MIAIDDRPLMLCVLVAVPAATAGAVSTAGIAAVSTAGVAAVRTARVATSAAAGAAAVRAAGTVAAGTRTRRKRAAQAGSHQFARPNRATIAGTSRHRTTTASTRMPAPSPVARIFRSVCPEVDIETKPSIKIAAALVTSRPVRPSPFTTADRAEPEASYSSRTLVKMNTS